MISCRARAALLACALAAPVLGQVEVELVPIAGEPLTADLVAISPSGEVSLRDSDRTFALADLMEIRANDKPSVPAESWKAGRLWLRTGCSMGGSKLEGAGDAFTVVTQYGPTPASFRIEHVAAFRTGTATPEDAGFAAAIENPSKNKDLVFAWDRNGESLRRYSMLVAGIEGDNLRVDAGGKVRDLPLSRVYGVVFGDNTGAPARLPRSEGQAPAVEIFGTFGAPLRGHLRGWDGAQCHLALAEGPVLDIECAMVSRIRIDSGRVAYLTDVEPDDIRQVAAVKRVRPWLRNRTPMGQGLKLGERSFSRGLCLLPRTSLTWNLDGSFDVFEAMVGIDGRSNDLAHAEIRVLADDRVVFESGPVTLASQPRPVSIDLAGVEKLTLEADFGNNLDIGDHCVFADARLRKN